MFSCKGDEDDPKINQNPVPRVTGAPANLTVEIGEEVTLDASGSTDPENKALTFTWELISQPQGSSVVINVGSNDELTFIPTHAGSYRVKLTCSDGEKTASQEVTVTCVAPNVTFPKTISDDINADVTWHNINPTPGEPDYIVSKSINVNARLTIAPGVVVRMADQSQLTVNPQGKIVAIGTEPEHITFTGTGTTSPTWVGIAVSSSSDENELNYVDIAFAGSGFLQGLSNLKASLGVDDGNLGKIKVRNTLITDGGGYGIYVEKNATITVAENVSIIDNAGTSVAIPISQVGNLLFNNSFSGSNGYDAVEIIGSDIANQGEVSWPGFQDGTVYYISGDLTVRSGLEIQPGVNIELASNVGINILDSDAYINAIGTATKKITFSGRTNSKGFWRGISISSANPMNILEFVEISNAGSGFLPNLTSTTASVGVDGGNLSHITIRNSVISDGKGYGLYVESGSVIDGFSNNEIKNMLGTPLALPANEVGKLDAASKFSEGNNDNAVEIILSTLNRNDLSVWKAFTDGTKYFVTGNVDIRTPVQIEAGARFEFSADKTFIVHRDNNSYIIAKGTAQKKIVFTGKNQTKGYWGGIAIISNDDKNEFDYVEVSYGGGLFLTGLTNTKANIGLDGDNSAKLKLTNSTITNSGGWGLVKEPGATMNADFKTSNGFTANTEGMYKE